MQELLVELLKKSKVRRLMLLVEKRFMTKGFKFQCLNVPVILIAGGFNELEGVLQSAELYNPKTGFSCFITALPTARFNPVANGLTVCGGGESSCFEFFFESDGVWSPNQPLDDPRVGSIGWNSSRGLVLIGGYPQSDTAELVGSGNIFNISPPRL